MYTYELCLTLGKRRNHYSILYNGEVCAFGAMFYGKNGDNKRLVSDAVRTMNFALKKGRGNAGGNAIIRCKNGRYIVEVGKAQRFFMEYRGE